MTSALRELCILERGCGRGEEEIQKFIFCADVIYEWSLRTKFADVEFLELELGVGLTSVAVVGGLLRSVVVVLGGAVQWY